MRSELASTPFRQAATTPFSPEKQFLGSLGLHCTFDPNTAYVSDFLKKFKGLFVEETETGQVKQPDPKEVEATPEVAPVVRESAAGAPGKVTNKFTGVLMKAMEAANLEGFDYLEFKQSLKSLEAMPMDEATRYKSAFAMASTMGVSAQKLIATAGHYMKVLQQEEQKFEQALAGQVQSRVGERQQQIQSLDRLVQEKEAKIKQLQAEIEQHRQQAEKLRHEVGSAQGKVETTKNNFIASYNNVVRQIQNDVERMKQYLSE